MFVEWALEAWTAAGIVWWLIAWNLVRAEKRGEPINPQSLDDETISVFKPLPPLGGEGLAATRAGLESFVAQLDEKNELLLGVHEKDRATVEAFVGEMRQRHPNARLEVIYRDDPDAVSNPKIAWQKILAPHARGELWFWSDVDIIAPPGLLHSARAEFSSSKCALLTFPYIIGEIGAAPALLDALFVNVEFYPGVLFLRRRGPIDFGLGAGLLFRRRDFEARANWNELGGALADDFMLGQRLQPVRISRTTLATVAEVASWRDAILHYLRWSKTVWWNRLVGAAARVITLPVLGWLIVALLHPAVIWPWLGLILMMQVDVIFAAAICRRVGLRRINLLVLEGWSIGRVGVWLACWLPWPVVWRGKKWHGPHAKDTQVAPGIRNVRH